MGLGTKNDCAGEGQQQFTQLTKASYITVSCGTEKYGHGSHEVWNQE
jgi:hypothetical protein